MILDPRGFDGDVMAWADQMGYLIYPEESLFIRIESPEKWQEWAEQLFGSPDRLGQDSPDPYDFDNRQDWAERFFQTQEF